MESKTNYTIVGISVVLMLFGLLVAALWLSEGFERKTYHYYTVYMQEPVSGLSEESLVKFNGVKIGTVYKITLNHANPQLVQLTLKIEEDAPITVSTEATLIAQGITGTTYLGLSASSATRVPLKVSPGQRYPVIPYKPSFLNQMENTVKDLSVSMKEFMSPENANNFKLALKNLQRVSSILATNDQSLHDTLQQMPKVTEELRRSITYFSEMSHDVSTAGKQLSITMQSGKDAIDVISQQALPPAISLLHRLDVIAANIEQLSVELRKNPSIVIRGTTPPKKGPGE
ncbi:MAG: ABC transporter substrate-binding protein [Legionella sp.]|nr:MAG: ABC transporter substrate-binding protein [Legionella sp.]